MQAKKILVVGIVQGVGFRPFVQRIAIKNSLTGYVRNLGGSEVEIFVEGSEERIKNFLEDLIKKKPRVAKIEEISVIEAEPKGFKDFVIKKSGFKFSKRSMIPPDFAMCDFCKREILDPRSRFYGYPFHSCAWCGPRFSMIERIPYDRENTSMRDFPLCDECLREYNDIKNVRRYHIQGISCPRCGPKVWLSDKDGKVIECSNPIKEAARLIDEGFIIAVKGIGGFHIAALATDDDVVLKLRRRKRRKAKPFAIMALDENIASSIVVIDEKALMILRSPESPILLLPEKEGSPVSRYVAPGLRKQGIMLAYTPLHYLLLKETLDGFLIMTSGNIHEKPMVIDNETAFKILGNIADFFLLHNRRIVNRVDDSVVRFTDGEPTLLRRGRGYAPEWIRIPIKLKREIIAFGAELQNAGGIGFDDKVILTQFIGDTDKFENLVELEKYLNFFIRTYDINPSDSLIVADKHPLYSSRKLAEKWAEEYGSPILFVQHHLAHIASVVAENRIKDTVVGVAIDGVGYGDDRNIWGGEIIVLKEDGRYERVGHLEYIPLPGGDRAVRYPIRSLIGFLSTFMVEDEIIDFLRERNLVRGLPLGEKEARVAINQCKNAILHSSTGRFLDSVSALLGICFERDYEGEPAIKLEEFSYGGKIIEDLSFRVIKLDGKYIIRTSKFLEEVINRMNEIDEKSIGATVQFKLGESLGTVAAEVAEMIGTEIIVISGGSAVNDYIIKGVRRGINGYKLYRNRKVPPGDGGIALGQIYLAGVWSDD